MNNTNGNRKDREPATGRLDEKKMAVLVRGVFWFTWMTAKYRAAAGMAARIEGQRPELN